MASTFASSLELVRQGQIELRQSLAFGPLFVRRRKTDGPSDRELMSDELETRGPRPRPPEQPRSPSAHLRILEALLFASAEPLAPAELAPHLGEGTDVEALLVALQAQYAPRGVNLVQARRQMGLPHRRRSRLPAAARDDRQPAAVAAPRSRPSRSSPTTSRRPAPKSKKCAASRPARARSTC